MFNSHSLLHSGSLCASKAELRKKKTGNIRFFWEPRPTNRPPSINVGQARLGRPVQLPASRQEQGHCSSGRNLSLSSQRSPREQSAGVTKADKGAPQLQCYTDTQSHKLTPWGHGHPKPKHNWLHMVTQAYTPREQTQSQSQS